MEKTENVLDTTTINIELISPQEKFLQVEGFPDYYISDMGRLVSKRRKTAKIIKPRVDKAGYSHYTLIDKYGQMCQLLAHRLVAMSFIKNRNPNKKNEVHHIKKGDFPKDNSYKNLIWTSKEDHVSLELPVELYLKIDGARFKDFKSYTSLAKYTDIQFNTLYPALKKKPTFQSCGTSFYELENNEGRKFLIATHPKEKAV